jgi:hypothetical protein
MSRNHTSNANAVLSTLAGGSRENMHFRSGMTQEQIGEGSPCTISIGSDTYRATVLAVKRNAAGRISYVKVQREGRGFSKEATMEFRLRQTGQLRSAGHGSYGLTLGFAETRLDPSF